MTCSHFTVCALITNFDFSFSLSSNHNLGVSRNSEKLFLANDSGPRVRLEFCP